MNGRNTAIRRRVQAAVLCEALELFLSEECPNKARLIQLLAKLPSEGGGTDVDTGSRLYEGTQMYRVQRGPLDHPCSPHLAR